MLQSLTHSQLRAAQRMFELTLDEIKGAFFFNRLFVEVRQNIRNVDQMFHFSPSTLRDALKQLGVVFTKQRGGADAELVLTLHGRGNV